ncbi:MAG: DNA recombination/repair protein RecA, partial [Patescibacteria group bacterium]
PPFKMAEFDVMYNRGISFEGDLLDLSAKYEITRKSGAFYTYKDIKLGQGRENVKSFLMENEKVLREIEKDVKTLLYGTPKAKEKVIAKLPANEKL